MNTTVVASLLFLHFSISLYVAILVSDGDRSLSIQTAYRFNWVWEQVDDHFEYRRTQRSQFRMIANNAIRLLDCVNSLSDMFVNFSDFASVGKSLSPE